MLMVASNPLETLWNPDDLYFRKVIGVHQGSAGFPQGSPRFGDLKARVLNLQRRAEVALDLMKNWTSRAVAR